MAKTLCGLSCFAAQITSSVNEFFAFHGSGGDADITDSTTNCTCRSAGTYSNLLFSTDSTSHSTSTVFVFRKNSADGNQTFTVGASANGIFTDSTHTDAVVAGDKVVIEGKFTSAGFVDDNIYSAVFDATTNTVSRVGASIFKDYATASHTFFAAPVGDDANTGTAVAEAKCKNRHLKAFTIKNGLVTVSSNSNGSTSTWRSRKNGANGTIAISITGSTNGLFEDTTHSDSVVSGDDFNYSYVTGTGTVNISINEAYSDYVSTNGDGILSAMEDSTATIAANKTDWEGLAGFINLVTVASESITQAKSIAAFTFSQLTINVPTNTITAASTFTLRANSAAAGSVSASITASTAGIFSDTTNTYTSSTTDLMNYRLVTGATGTSMKPLHMSVWTNISGILNIPLSETTSISESINKLCHFFITKTETTSITDTRIRKSIPKITTETKTISDSLLRRVIRPLSETKAISESIKNKIFRPLSETITITATQLRKPIRNILDDFEISDSILRSPITRKISQIVGINESKTRKVIPKITTETSSISDSFSKFLSMHWALADTISIVETQLRKVKPKLVTETKTISDALAFIKFSGFVHFIRNITENIVIVESQAGFTGSFTDAFTSIIGISRKPIPKIATESTTISATQTRTPIPYITEIIPITDGTDGFTNHFTNNFVNASNIIRKFKPYLYNEIIIIPETIVRTISRKLATQSTVISDAITGFRIKLRNLTDTIVISDSLSKFYSGFRHFIEGPCSLLFSGQDINEGGTYVEISGAGSLINELTIVAWVKFIDGEGGFGGVISYLNGNIHNRLILSADGKTVLFELSLSGTGITSISYTMADPGFVNNWHHFAAWYDGNNMSLYIDGVPVGSLVPASGSINTGSTKTQIGWGSDSVYHIKGNIAEVSEYDVNLTDSEISELYTNGTSTVTRGQIHYWKFNEGSSYKIKDSVGTRDAIVINDPQWSTDLESPIPNRSIYGGYISDSIVKSSLLKSIVETISTADSLLRKSIPRIATQVTAISHTISRLANYFRTPTETVTILETRLRTFIPKMTAQAVSISDSLRKKSISTITEIITVFDSMLRTVTPYISEIVNVIESPFCKNEDLDLAYDNTITDDAQRRTVIPFLEEFIDVSEDLARSLIGRAMSEITTISDSLSKIATFFRSIIQTTAISGSLVGLKGAFFNLIENITITESMLRKSILSIAESTSISEFLAKLRSVSRSISQTVVISESLSRLLNVFRSLIESTSIIETQLRKIIPKVNTQTTSISDSISHLVNRIISQTVTISDNQLRKIIPILASQTITISDTLLRKSIARISQTVSISESLLRKIQLSLIETKAISETQLRTVIPRLVTQTTSISESIRRNITRKITQIITILESLTGPKGALIQLSDTIATSETLNRLASHFRTITETKSISDSLLRKYIPSIVAQTVNITESMFRKVGRLMATQTTSIADSLSRLSQYFRTVSQSTTISDTQTRKSIPSISAQAVSIVDTMLRKVKPSITAQTVSISDSISRLRSVFRSLTDTTTISEVLTKVANHLRTMSDTTSISESKLRKVIPKITTQVTTISESQLRKVIYSISQSMTIVDSLLRTIKARLSDTTIVSDSTKRLIKRIKTETVSVSDSIRRKLIFSIAAEVISVLDSLLKRLIILRNIAQSTSITESILRKTIRNISQTVSISESLNRLGKYFRTITQTILVHEFLIYSRNKVAIVFSETVDIIESIQRTISRTITQNTSISDSLSGIRNVPRFLIEHIPITDTFARLPGNFFTLLINEIAVRITDSGFIAPKGPSWRWLFSPWRNISFSNKFDPDRKHPYYFAPGPPPTAPDPVVNAKEEEGRKSSFTNTFTPKKKGKVN